MWDTSWHTGYGRWAILRIVAAVIKILADGSSQPLPVFIDHWSCGTGSKARYGQFFYLQFSSREAPPTAILMDQVF
jgi:hypothetical protein